MKKLLLVLFAVLGLQQASAQVFKADADIRQRGEYLHGFGNLSANDAKPGAFVIQRARLNFGYEADKLKLMISLQDVSTWGATPQIAISNGQDSFSLAQAWVEMQATDQWSLKLGRQPLVYDNQRILGGLDWAMQGRFHDAALLRYKKGSLKLDLVGAFNQEKINATSTDYTITNLFSYKMMQMLHLSKKWEKVSGSLLLMNNGFQRYDANKLPDGVYNRQTAGLHFDITPIEGLKMTAAGYSQFGSASAVKDLSAYNVLVDAFYQAKESKVGFGVGFEMLSGTDQKGSKRNLSFFPLYGTNHAFNGYMDYFYVGNHANNVGLNDLNAEVKVKTGAKSNLLLRGHYFTANADFANNEDKYLGTELDLVFSTPVMKDVSLQAGYSQMFASSSMSLIKKNLPSGNTNNWAWVMFVIKPTLFKSEITKPVEQ